MTVRAHIEEFIMAGCTLVWASFWLLTAILAAIVGTFFIAGYALAGLFLPAESISCRDRPNCGAPKGRRFSFRKW